MSTKNNTLSLHGFVAVRRNVETGHEYIDINTFSNDLEVSKTLTAMGDAEAPLLAKIYPVSRYIFVGINEIKQSTDWWVAIGNR